MNILTKQYFLNRDVTTQLRGVAMLLILLGHIIAAFGDRCFIPLIPNRFTTPWGGVGCAIFLFLSGYGLSESLKKTGLKDYWKKKISRLVIPYILAIGFFYLSVLFSPLANESKKLLLQENWYWAYYWFVKYIVIWYVVFWIVHKFDSIHSLLWLLILSIGSFFFIHCEYMVEQSLSFPLGVLVSKKREIIVDRWNMKRISKLAIVMFFLGLFALALKQLPAVREMGQNTIPYNLLQLLIKLPLGIFVMIVFHSVKWKDFGVVAFFGIIAYELYLVQMPYTMYIQASYTNALIFLVQVVLMAYILYRADNWMINKCLSYFK